MDINLYSKLVKGFRNYLDNSSNEHKKEELQNYLQISEKILNLVDSGIYIFDNEYSLLWTNTRLFKIHGYSTEELNNFGNDHFLGELHSDDLILIEQNLKQVKEGNDNTVFVRIKHKCNKWICIKHTLKVFKRDFDNKPLLFMGIANDITDFISCEEDIKRLSDINYKLKEKFIEKLKITKREKEIWKILATGLNALEASQKLHISYNTMRTHKNNLMKKLGINNIAQLSKNYWEFFKEINNKALLPLIISGLFEYSWGLEIF